MFYSLNCTIKILHSPYILLLSILLSLLLSSHFWTSWRNSKWAKTMRRIKRPRHFSFLYFNIFPNIKAGMGVLSVSRFLVGLWGWYLNQQSPRVVKTYFSSPTHQSDLTKTIMANSECLIHHLCQINQSPLTW